MSDKNHINSIGSVPRLLRMPQVMDRTGLSRSTIYLRLEQGRFPKSIPLGGRAVGWLESELDAWIVEQVQARRTAGGGVMTGKGYRGPPDPKECPGPVTTERGNSTQKSEQRCHAPTHEATQPNVYKQALALVARDFALIPLHGIEDGRCTCGNSKCSSPGKHPVTKHGLKDASKDIEQLAKWFKDRSDRNIGVVTGKASGVTVIDIDVDPQKGVDGEETWACLCQEYDIPRSDEVKTGRGRHLYFKYTKRLQTGTNRLGPGIDVRNDGGYVVAEGSMHRSGKVYIGNGIPQLTELPDELLASVCGHKSITAPSENHRIYPRKCASDGTRLEQVKTMLKHVDFNDYDPWRHIGVILGREFGCSDEAWTVYKDWSDQWDGEHDASRAQKMAEALNTLSQQKHDPALTIKTLHKLARDGGWESPAKGKKPGKVDILTQIAVQNSSLYVGEQGVCGEDDLVADMTVGNHIETHPVSSKAYRRWLTFQYKTQGGKGGITESTFKEVVSAIEAEVWGSGKSTKKRLHYRTGRSTNSLTTYFDLGTDDCQVVEIGPDGWHLIVYSECPVRFIRCTGQKLLPTPKTGRDILTLLGSFLNMLETILKLILIVAWATYAMQLWAKYPFLSITGEQGAAKSTTCEVLKRLIDPSAAIAIDAWKRRRPVCSGDE